MWLDAVGTQYERAPPDARIVSLVPSITELLFDLGCGDRVVGRTGFCIHPREQVRNVPKVGGTKDVRIATVRALRPSHAIVNVDENTTEVVEKLRAFVPHVIVTHPNSAQDNAALFALLGGIFGAESAASTLAQRLHSEIEACGAIEWPVESVLYLVWKNPWMTIAADTYIARTLALIGWQVLQPPGGWSGAARYPTIAEIGPAIENTGRVLLSTEPYMFRQRDVDELRKQSSRTVDLIDAEMTSWYGSRAVRGLAYLRQFRKERLAKPSGES
jgi:hypothetical protein